MSDPSLQSIPQFSNLEFILKGSTTINANDSGSGAVGTAAINHNLGYIPIIQAFVNLSNVDWLPLPALISASTSHTSLTITEWIYVAGVNSTQASFAYSNSGGGNRTFNIVYYLFRANANN